jgi:uncharacterized protein YbjT (DUF2867 family)
MEKLTKESGIPWAILRAASFYQNLGNFFGPGIKAGQDLYCAFGDKASVNYVDVRDIGAVRTSVEIIDLLCKGCC